MSTTERRIQELLKWLALANRGGHDSEAFQIKMEIDSLQQQAILAELKER